MWTAGKQNHGKGWLVQLEVGRGKQVNLLNYVSQSKHLLNANAWTIGGKMTLLKDTAQAENFFKLRNQFKS